MYRKVSEIIAPTINKVFPKLPTRLCRNLLPFFAKLYLTFVRPLIGLVEKVQKTKLLFRQPGASKLLLTDFDNLVLAGNSNLP